MENNRTMYMNDNVSHIKNTRDKERCVILGEYIIETSGTVRQTAAKFGVSKSTVHKDVSERLYLCNRPLYSEVRKILLKNKEERHIRGGLATKEKYIALKKGL